MSDQQDDYIDKETLIGIVNNQIEEGEPRTVKETLIRLTMSGTSREEALEMMACALAIEVFDVMKNEAKFNGKRYKENLDALPNMDFLGEEDKYI